METSTDNNNDQSDDNEYSSNKEVNICECTYDRGYITQEIFGGKTGYEEKQTDGHQSTQSSAPYGDPFGVCASGIAICHSEHQIYDLGARVNFKCDCGNI